jgi:hypothetical protein
MSILERIFSWCYAQSIRLYPLDFRTTFGAEIQSVFATALHEAQRSGPINLWHFIWREVHDWPVSIWREHLRARKEIQMNQNLTWRPLKTKELVVAMAIFVLPVIIVISELLFQNQVFVNPLRIAFILTLMAFILIVSLLGVIKGFPRWAVPYLGIVVTAIVMLEPSWQIWELFYQPVERAIGYYTKTLQVRVLYSTLRVGFFWLSVFVAATLLILLLAIWPRTRRLAQHIRQDWTLLSFMLYSGVVFALELVFEEYTHDDLWKMACWGCLALGAWVYLKSGSPRKRMLSLLVGITFAYWIAAIGKFYLVPLQTWGAFHGYQYDVYSRFEFWRTLGEWGWVMLFLLAPALLTLIPHSQEIAPDPDGNFIPA